MGSEKRGAETRTAAQMGGGLYVSMLGVSPYQSYIMNIV